MKEISTIVLLVVLSLHTSHARAVKEGDRVVQVQVHAPDQGPAPDGYQVSIRNPNAGIAHDLNLVKVQVPPILNNGVQVLTLHSIDDVTGQPLVDRWKPTQTQIDQAHELYVNTEANAAFRIHRDHETGEHRLNGIVNGVAITHDGVQHVVTTPPDMNPQLQRERQRMDYIDLDLGRNMTPNPDLVLDADARVQAVVELVIVCDKEFGDVFNHNQRAILDYWTVYMWDINSRYRTLPSDVISFRVNGFVLITATSAQPFIENARGPDGKADFYRILEPYSYWVYQNMGGWPAFDLAPLITNTELEWRGGLAYMRGACGVRPSPGTHVGTAVWNDNGDWGSLTVGAHELGHNLGAPHDDDPAFPGGCADRGYIMAGATDALRWYFSSCSDRTISEFVRSTTADCLQRLDGTPILDPSYGSPLAPTMLEQCRRLYTPDATLETESCTVMRCRFFRDGSWWIGSRPPVDNTICTGGRCFRGSCRPTS